MLEGDSEEFWELWTSESCDCDMQVLEVRNVRSNCGTGDYNLLEGRSPEVLPEVREGLVARMWILSVGAHLEHDELLHGVPGWREKTYVSTLLIVHA